MSTTLKCFAKIEDTTAAREFTGETYQAYTNAGYTRVVLNPEHRDPKQSVQVEVRGGERDATDPLRFERIEVYEDDAQTPVQGRLTFYADVHGGTQPLERSDELTLKSVADEEEDEKSLEALIADHAGEQELTEAIKKPDYKTLEAELVRLAPEMTIPQKKTDRVAALIALTCKSVENV